MATDRYKRNCDWYVEMESGTYYGSYDHAILAVLMDVRGELRKLNGLLACPNFAEVPWTLKAIKANTAKPRKAKRRAA
jgi:hypothetical protein